MKVNGRTAIFGMLVLVLALFATSVSAIDIQITETEINGVEVFPDDFVHLDLEKGDEIELKVEFVSLDSLDDVEVRAVILSSEDDIEEVLELFDTREDKKYVKTLNLELPQDAEEDEYRLLLIISDRDNEELTESFNIYVNSKRHDLVIEDVILSPFGRVQAGDYLFAKVRLENFGQNDEDNVRVVVSVPELGLQATSYVDSVEFDDQEETEEMLLRIPECADATQYRLNVLVEYNDGRDHLTQEQSLFVAPGENCDVAANDEPAVVVIREANEDPTAALVADDAEDNGATSQTRKALEVVLLVLVVLLVVIGLLIGFMKLRSDE